MILGKPDNEWSAALLPSLRPYIKREHWLLASPLTQFIASVPGWLARRKVIWLGSRRPLPFVARFADTIIAPNQANEVRYLRAHVPAKKIHCLYPPCALAEPDALTPNRTLVIASDGSLPMNQGLGTVLRAFGLAREIVGNIKLVLGKVNENKADIEWSIRQLGLNGSVQLAPGKKSSWLEPAHLYVWPVLSDEPVPLSLLQALAQGLVVIAPDKLRVREFIEHDRIGFLIKDFNAETLAQTIIALARDPEQRARLGEAGRRFVEARQVTAESLYRQIFK